MKVDPWIWLKVTSLSFTGSVLKDDRISLEIPSVIMWFRNQNWLVVFQQLQLSKSANFYQVLTFYAQNIFYMLWIRALSFSNDWLSRVLQITKYQLFKPPTNFLVFLKTFQLIHWNHQSVIIETLVSVTNIKSYFRFTKTSLSLVRINFQRPNNLKIPAILWKLGWCMVPEILFVQISVNS